MTTHFEIPAAAVLPVQMADAMTGEAPFWDVRDGTLWWIDIQGQRLLGFQPTTGDKISRALPTMPGFVAGRRSGGLLLGLEDGVYAFSVVDGLGKCLLAVEADRPENRLNDGKPDPRGRLWFGSMDKSGSGAPNGALYRVTSGASLHRERQSVRIPNAIAFSPDGTRMYFADSRTRRLEVMDYDIEAGMPGPSRDFAVYQEGEAPDGVCVDDQGGVWIAVVGGRRIERRSADGRLDVIVHLPVSRPTMPMLGGPDGHTLFVTSQRRFLSADALRKEPLAGQLIAVRVQNRACAAFLADI